MRRAIFTWSPLVLAVVILVVLHVSVLALAIVAGLWNAEHTLMQRYGITRIYGRKAGQQDGRLERAMLLSWLAMAIDLGGGRSRHGRPGCTASPWGARTRWRSRCSSTSARGPRRSSCRPSSWSAALVAAWIVTEHRRGPTANPAKWLYLGSTAALFAVVVVDPIAGLMGYVGAHALEYFVIVHQSLGRRFAGDQPAPSSPLGRAVRARTGRLGLLRRLPGGRPRHRHGSGLARFARRLPGRVLHARAGCTCSTTASSGSSADRRWPKACPSL